MKIIPVEDLQVGQLIILKDGTPKKIIHISRRIDFDVVIIYWQEGFIRVKPKAKVKVKEAK